MAITTVSIRICLKAVSTGLILTDLGLNLRESKVVGYQLLSYGWNGGGSIT
jgi:hypothetical protein